ncbi:MAG: hypothetical protein ACK41V_08810 [Acidovorax sp.]|uniref:hypothetical protein n=1 Tax=Acidovorax sp. TaxID=1872122 RepID=UPI003918F753
MNYEFDLWGWYVGQAITPGLRTTTVAPANKSVASTIGAPRSNWTGVAWVVAPYVATPPAPEPAGDPRMWWIDLGPFKDRLGMDAPAIYASTSDACKGVVGMVEGRKYIDLKDPRIALMMGVLIATAHPTANPIWPGSGPMTEAKRRAILDTPTTEYERHIKGLT